MAFYSVQGKNRSTFVAKTIERHTINVYCFRMVKAYKKIYVFCDAISFFATSEWKFESARVQKLNKKMSTEDKTLFFSDMKMMNWDVYIVNIVRGVRVYMVHEPMDTVEEGQRRIVKYYYAHQIIKGVLFGLLLSIFWRLLSCVI